MSRRLSETRLKTMQCPLCYRTSMVKINFKDGSVKLKCRELNCSYERFITGNHYPHTRRYNHDSKY